MEDESAHVLGSFTCRGMSALPLQVPHLIPHVYVPTYGTLNVKEVLQLKIKI